MTKSQAYFIIIQVSFITFLLIFLYAVLRWIVADARRRGKRAWPLACLLVGSPILGLLARKALKPLVPSGVALSLMLGVPMLTWLVWLFLRPGIKEHRSDEILSGTDRASGRWILGACTVASGYNMCGAWLAQFVLYPLYFAVPQASFDSYFAQYNEYIVFPVIVAASLSWILTVMLVLNRPRYIPASAAWSATGLALLGFIASAAFEFPNNKLLMEHGFNEQAIHAKIVGNWFRLVPWTIQAGLTAWMCSLATRTPSDDTHAGQH